jgi:ABC-2 type transport system ATP-binding protein
MSDTALLCDNLRFGYSSRRFLFDSLSLRIETGAIYGLLGKNGAGKTSLLKLLAGLRFPARGECRVFGRPAKSRSPAIYRDLSIVPEDFIVPDMTARAYGRRYGALYPRFDRSRYTGLLRNFELPPDSRLCALSHGQRKKAILAFALAANTRILLLDEPTNGLDIPSKGQFRRALAEIDRTDRAIIISTHQVRDVDTLIEAALILDNGKIIFHQPRSRVDKRLSTTVTGDRGSADRALYAEARPDGWALLERNTGTEPSTVDLEMLFNAVVADPARVGRLFDTGEQEA